MKRIWKRALCGLFAVCLFSTVLCSAVSARSSAYLDLYGAAITPISGGGMVVTVDVAGVGYMTQIGATTIYIYESTDNKSFKKVATYDYEDYPEMMGSGTQYYEDPVTYPGTPGYYYKASVYCYAANANGSDEKNYTTASRRAIR
nr:hypothetical protein [uncultured Dysosmobacter sp.]